MIMCGEHSLTLHDSSAEEQSCSNSNPPHFTHSKDEFKPGHTAPTHHPPKYFPLIVFKIQHILIFPKMAQPRCSDHYGQQDFFSSSQSTR